MSREEDAAAEPSQVETAARYWNLRHQDAGADAHDNYLSHSLVQAYISLKAFGSLMGHMDAAIHALRSRTRPGDRILSLGCGPATKEKVMALSLPDRQFLGLDIAEEVLAQAREEVEREGIENLEIRRGDFNHLDEQDLGVESGSLQVILGLGAVHHVENLEGLWAWGRKVLAPTGVFLAQEYIGPNRFQWTEAQLREGSRALRDLVPEAHKPHHQEVRRVSVQEIMALDPSEAVRSAEILPTCREAGYEVLAFVGAGGSLLQPVLMHQISSYDPLDWEHNLVLARLFAEEDRLLRQGVLEHDFGMLVARPAPD